MKISVQGLRVIVTAAGAGIGRAIAETFLRNGAQVHICDVVEKRLVECQSTLTGIGVTLADVSNPEQVDHLFDDALNFLGGLDVLVNNAGISGPTGPVEEITPIAWEHTMAVNINGQFYCTRRAVPFLKKTGGGSIINIASTAGLMGYPLRTPYAASKWAVIGFTKSLTMELGRYGIRVNAICPGSVDGPRMDAVIAAEAAALGVSEDEIRQGYYRQTSMHTFISTQDIANMALFLSSAAGSKISGQALSVDGYAETLRTLV